MKFYEWADIKGESDAENKNQTAKKSQNEEGEEENSSVEEENESDMNMSFDNFALICNELGMFSEEAQLRFLGLDAVSNLAGFSK